MGSVPADGVDRPGRVLMLVGREPACKRDLAAVWRPGGVALVSAAPRQPLEASPRGAHRPDVRVLWCDGGHVHDPTAVTRPGEGSEEGVWKLVGHTTPPGAVYGDRFDLTRSP